MARTRTDKGATDSQKAEPASGQCVNVRVVEIVNGDEIGNMVENDVNMDKSGEKEGEKEEGKEGGKGRVGIVEDSTFAADRSQKCCPTCLLL